MSERDILEFAVIGIDTEIVRAVELFKSDRETEGSQMPWVCKLAAMRGELGEKLKAMDEDEELVTLHGVAFPRHIVQEIERRRHHKF